MIDHIYILGRDNHSCVFCHTDLQDQSYKISKIEPKRTDDSYDNLIVTCEKPCTPTGVPNFPLSAVPGRLIVISGPMFGGKSTSTRSLLDKYTRVLGAYTWVKPDIDTRGAGVTTHNQENFQAKVISAVRPDKHLTELESFPIVAFDEIQFYSNRILYVVHQLLKKGVLVIVNGLKTDARRSLFGMTHYLLAEADDIVHLKAICNECNTIDVATRTKRLDHTNGPAVEIGGAEKFYAVCPDCDR